MSVTQNFSEELEDMVVVITGGAGILGSTIARNLGESGGKLALLDVDEEGLEELSGEFSRKEIKHISLKTNVLSKESLNEAREKIIDKYGRLDVLINGAGGNKSEATTGEDSPFFDLSEDGLKWVFNLNFLGTLLSCQVFGEEFTNQGRGSIINISSMAAITPLTKTPAYSAAKAAVSNFTQWLAVHMSRNYSTDIRVNAIAPGFFLTQQNRYLLIDAESEELTDRGQKIIDHTPMARFGDPEDLVSTVRWLASPESEFVHGSIIPIDGGFSAFGGV
ncbi:SDR family oxidoreductase [Candidatus Bipolaricaulota bacterium]|nr:SDR family oxidoreductase [Candidatus Bipolaricaulota bacterium]